jgi:hypothetical protein
MRNGKLVKAGSRQPSRTGAIVALQGFLTSPSRSAKVSALLRRHGLKFAAKATRERADLFGVSDSAGSKSAYIAIWIHFYEFAYFYISNIWLSTG